MQFKSKSKSNEQSNGLINNCWLVQGHTPEHLVGRVCQAIEMLGLKDTQEKATKDILRKEIYSFFSRDYGALFVDTDLADVIHHVYEQERRYCDKQGLPPGHKGVYTLIKELPEDTSNLLED